MLSTILELAGFCALTASATLLGVILGGLLPALACGSCALGVVLVLVGLASGQPTGRRPRR